MLPPMNNGYKGSPGALKIILYTFQNKICKIAMIMNLLAAHTRKNNKAKELTQSLQISYHRPFK